MSDGFPHPVDRPGNFSSQKTAEQLEAENRELRAYLKAFCAATIEPEDLGRDVQAHEANPFIEYQFLYVEDGDPKADRTITGGQVRRAMELVGFDKLKIQPSDRTIADELTEARGLRHKVKALQEEARSWRSVAERLETEAQDLLSICDCEIRDQTNNRESSDKRSAAYAEGALRVARGIAARIREKAAAR